MPEPTDPFKRKYSIQLQQDDTMHVNPKASKLGYAPKWQPCIVLTGQERPGQPGDGPALLVRHHMHQAQGK